MVHMSAAFVVRLAVLAGLTVCSVASAQTLNCRGDFAQIGNSKGTILQKCGEPVFKDSFCKSPAPRVKSGGVVIAGGCETVDEWTYNPGYGQFMTMLQFEGGELKRIKYGDRVR